MNWASIIAKLMEILGPILSDLIKRWLDTKLKAAAKTFGAAPVTGASAARDLLTVALDATPRRQVMRRAFLRQAIQSVPGAMAAGKLNSADRKELAVLAEAADKE